ncbi:MAG: hypothetical protein WCV73_02555 [Patescibacteria group bacterium]
MKKILLYVVIAVVVAGAGGFYGGIKYNQVKSDAAFAKGNLQNFRTGSGAGLIGGRGNGAINGGFLSGEIIAKDDKSMTLKLRDGGSKIVFYSLTTEVSKFDAGTADDLVIGQTVSVNGKVNTDGTVVAQSVQIRPAMPIVNPVNNVVQPK